MHDSSLSRPLTPESPLASSLNHATSTIDDLTVALANFSRVPSPEPSLMMCCCGRDDCENANAWFSMKSKLESRLILSAGMASIMITDHLLLADFLFSLFRGWASIITASRSVRASARVSTIISYSRDADSPCFQEARRSTSMMIERSGNQNLERLREKKMLWKR